MKYDLHLFYRYDEGNELIRHEIGSYVTYMSYDTRGNCVSIEEPDGTTYFDYNHANMVTSIHYRTGVWNRFYYNARLQRYALEDSDGLRYFTWDGLGGVNLLAEQDVYGNVTAGYVHGYTPVSGIGSMVASEKDVDGVTYLQYPVYDHRGSVVRLTDENGEVTAYYSYNAWGERLQSEESSGVGNRFEYQSNWIELKDSGGELLLSPTRLYHSGVGRYLSRDPKGYRDSTNLYEAFGNPLNTTDPLGTVKLVLHGNQVADARGRVFMQQAFKGEPVQKLADALGINLDDIPQCMINLFNNGEPVQINMFLPVWVNKLLFRQAAAQAAGRFSPFFGTLKDQQKHIQRVLRGLEKGRFDCRGSSCLALGGYYPGSYEFAPTPKEMKDIIKSLQKSGNLIVIDHKRLGSLKSSSLPSNTKKGDAIFYSYGVGLNAHTVTYLFRVDSGEYVASQEGLGGRFIIDSLSSVEQRTQQTFGTLTRTILRGLQQSIGLPTMPSTGAQTEQSTIRDPKKVAPIGTPYSGSQYQFYE